MMQCFNFSIWEALMLICFACSWPLSIIKALKTKIVAGKSPTFMILLIVGYLMGIIHKLLYKPDVVIYFYMVNMLLVIIDLSLYYYYSSRKQN